jgi:hypothetical protein
MLTCMSSAHVRNRTYQCSYLSYAIVQIVMCQLLCKTAAACSCIAVYAKLLLQLVLHSAKTLLVISTHTVHWR